MRSRSVVLFAALLAGCGGAEGAPPATAANTSAAPEGAGTANDATSETPAVTDDATQAEPNAADATREGTREGATAAPKQIGARHVLVQWMGADRAGPQVLRTREQALVIATDVQHRAKAGEDLGRLAVEYSDEPNAGARGGSLGRFGHGQMVPAFEAAAFKLRVGEISDVVETPFGFHVIQRTE